MPHILQRIIFEGVEDGGEVAFARVRKENDDVLALVFGAKGDLRSSVERGAYDYLLKVRACDMKQYQQFILNKLGEIDSVASIESTFVMSEIKQNYGINF